MKTDFRLLVVAVLVIAGLRADAVAQTVGLSSPIRAGARTTYLDLLQKLMPDAKADATAQNTIPLRSIVEPRQKSALSGQMKFEFEPHWFNSHGKRLLMLKVDLTAPELNDGTPYAGEAVVLAVFAIEPGPTLVDALEIKTDRFTSFWDDKPLFQLNAQNDAIVVSSTHWNAGESFTQIDLLFVDDGRLKTIVSQLLYETQGCGNTFTEKPSFRAIAAAGKKYPDVIVRIKLTKEPDESACDRRTRGYAKHYQGRYFWNPVKRRYEGRSRELQALDRFNKR